MPKNKIDDLRNHLFETLERLGDKDDPMDIERAKAIADVGRVLVETAKVEVAYLRETGRRSGSGFLPDVDEVPAGKRLDGSVADITPARGVSRM